MLVLVGLIAVFKGIKLNGLGMDEILSIVETSGGAGISVSKSTNECGGSNRNDENTYALLITITCPS